MLTSAIQLSKPNVDIRNCTKPKLNMYTRCRHPQFNRMTTSIMIFLWKEMC